MWGTRWKHWGLKILAKYSRGGFMKTFKRALAMLVVSVGLAVGIAPAAFADYRTVVADWFYSSGTCAARGVYLAVTSPVYYNPTCVRNSTGRYTLYMWVKTGVGTGGGGGGGGSWSVPTGTVVD